ncbi:hypothetical protein [Bradyrhizobium sp. SZCCHNS2015]|uniref:hypothetical protein n=1 Tax=Bradyrhizobium sp. SZCCHNS2015 TaxID=3057305 RepID=UPI0028E84B99|nr:hypothetical protein [Bradyrhizobium sp. SZCCHNS2015]
MSKTERGYYRFTVKETGRGTFFLAAEPAGDTLQGLYGLLGIQLEENVSLEEAMRMADLLNNRMTALTLTK